MTDAEVITLMDSMRTKTGGFPASVTIGDYSNYASPPQSVIDAKVALETAKSTTVTLSA